MRSGLTTVWRLAASLQPAAERLGLAPGPIRAQSRCCAVGAFHCSAAPRADDKPSREGGSPENLPGQELDPNRAPPDSPPGGDSGASKGHGAPTRKDLEQADGGPGMAKPDEAAGPSGRPGEFPKGDPTNTGP